MIVLVHEIAIPPPGHSSATDVVWWPKSVCTVDNIQVDCSLVHVVKCVCVCVQMCEYVMYLYTWCINVQHAKGLDMLVTAPFEAKNTSYLYVCNLNCKMIGLFIY